MMGDGCTCILGAMFDKMQMNPRIKCSALEVAICKKIGRGLLRSQFSFESTSLVIQVASSCHNHMKTTRQQQNCLECPLGTMDCRAADQDQKHQQLWFCVCFESPGGCLPNLMTTKMSPLICFSCTEEAPKCIWRGMHPNLLSFASAVLHC